MTSTYINRFGQFGLEVSERTSISLADGHDGLFSDVLIIGVLESIKRYTGGYTGGYTVIKFPQWTLTGFTGSGLSYSNLEIFRSNPSDLLG